jgi:4-hydroxyphenylpyruvate dioxygenase and related hemolysins
MKVLGLSFAGSATPAHQQLSQFLTEVFGLTPTRLDGNSADFFLLGDGSYFAVSAPGEMGQTHRSVGFEVDDLDAALAQLRSHGIQTDDQPSANSELRYAHFVAPDGRLYELVERVRPLSHPHQE